MKTRLWKSYGTAFDLGFMGDPDVVTKMERIVIANSLKKKPYRTDFLDIQNTPKINASRFWGCACVQKIMVWPSVRWSEQRSALRSARLTVRLSPTSWGWMGFG